MLRLCGYCQSGSQTICAQVMHLEDVFFTCQADTFTACLKALPQEPVLLKTTCRRVWEPSGEAEAQQEGKQGPGDLQPYRGCGIPEQVLYLVCHSWGLGFPRCLLKSQSFAVSLPQQRLFGVSLLAGGFLAPRQVVMAPGSAAASPRWRCSLSAGAAAGTAQPQLSWLCGLAALCSHTRAGPRKHHRRIQAEQSLAA